MKYTQQNHRFTERHASDRRLTGSRSGLLEKRSVAETLLETISETLGQGGLRPGFSQPAAGRRGRARQLTAAAVMLVGLAAVAFVVLRPASDPLPAGAPVALLEIARGRADMFGGGQASSRLLMLSGGEPIHAGAVIETAAAPRAHSRAGVAPAGDAPGGRVAVRLAGGQSMRLDSGSRVRFATSSSVVLERGTVYVDSAGGDNVEVRTALGIVRDIGTQFEVRLLAADGAESLRVRVREGSVELEGGEEPHLVVAGEELRLDAGGGIEHVASPVYGRHWDWVTETAPTPNVAGRPLREFLDWAEREGGWTVRFADQATAAVAEKTILHGDVRDLTLTEAATLVLGGSGLGYRVEGGAFIVEPSDGT